MIDQKFDLSKLKFKDQRRILKYHNYTVFNIFVCNSTVIAGMEQILQTDQNELKVRNGGTEETDLKDRRELMPVTVETESRGTSVRRESPGTKNWRI